MRDRAVLHADTPRGRKLIDVTPYPELLDGDSVTFGMTCPYTEIDGSIFEILSISGTVVLRDQQDGPRLGGGSSRTP